MSLTVYPAKTHSHTVPGKGKQICCRGCRQWFDGILAACPHCDHKRPAWNKWLRTAKLDGQLREQAQRDADTNDHIRKVYSEKPPR